MYLNPTAFLTYVLELQGLARVCSHLLKHPALRGTIVVDGRAVCKTSLAGDYEFDLCSAYAWLVSDWYGKYVTDCAHCFPVGASAPSLMLSCISVLREGEPCGADADLACLS